MLAHHLLGSLALLRLALLFWQWWVARRFMEANDLEVGDLNPGVTVLKPVKGLDSKSEECFRSRLQQSYDGSHQVLFCAEKDDPAEAVIERLSRWEMEVVLSPYMTTC
ncbi:MAG: hypothetical protein CMO80_10565 [Verrucomicrobiales bacterium]|nr:hypothetical protein [Verrucomicrobiales bacterium]